MLSCRMVSTMFCLRIFRVAYCMVANTMRNTPKMAPRY